MSVSAFTSADGVEHRYDRHARIAFPEEPHIPPVIGVPKASNLLSHRE